MPPLAMSPATLCVPIVTWSVASWSVTSKPPTDECRGLEAEAEEHLVADRHGGVDACDLPVGELRGAAVLLHVEAEQAVDVVERAVAVRVAKDRGVRYAVAVVRRCGVREVAG